MSDRSAPERGPRVAATGPGGLESRSWLSKGDRPYKSGARSDAIALRSRKIVTQNGNSRSPHDKSSGLSGKTRAWSRKNRWRNHKRQGGSRKSTTWWSQGGAQRSLKGSGGCAVDPARQPCPSNGRRVGRNNPPESGDHRHAPTVNAELHNSSPRSQETHGKCSRNRERWQGRSGTVAASVLPRRPQIRP